MKKKLILYILMAAIFAALALSVLPPDGSADSTGICYLAVNDKLSESYPAFIGGITYIPASALSAYGIYTTTFSDNSTISVYTGTVQLYFNMSSGGCYDGSGNEYAVSAVYRSGAIYVPAVFVCNFFGISCTYIKGAGYGDIVRLNNGSAVLSDSNFLDAAKSSMQARNPAPAATASPMPSPSPTPSPSPSPSPNRKDTAVYLSFEGIPDEALLDTLEENGVRACFFLSARDVLDEPEIPARLMARGQRIGVLCGNEPEQDYAIAAGLIYELCRTQTLFVASSENPAACQEMADREGLIFWHYDIGGESVYAEVASQIASRTARADVRLQTGGAEDMPARVIAYLKSNKFSVRVFSETETPYRYEKAEPLSPLGP